MERMAMQALPVNDGEETGDGVLRVRCDAGIFDRASILRDILGYFLFSYNQIPLHLDDLEHVATEKMDSDGCKENVILKPRERREMRRKSREVSREMRNLEKLNESVKKIISGLHSAFEMIEHIPTVLLILGSSSKQPSAVFVVHFEGIFACFNHHERCLLKSENYTKSFSRKVTRELISHETGPSFTGMRKLFVFIKTHASSCVPDEFIPKRGYNLTKKVQPTTLELSFCCHCIQRGSELSSQDSTETKENTSGVDDMIWFQCKTSIQGFQSRAIG